MAIFHCYVSSPEGSIITTEASCVSLKLAHVGCVSRRNSLYFVYAPMPHVIVGAQMDGASEKLYSTTFRPLQRILDLRFETMSWRPFSQWDIHGNPLETVESI